MHKGVKTILHQNSLQDTPTHNPSRARHSRSSRQPSPSSRLQTRARAPHVCRSRCRYSQGKAVCSRRSSRTLGIRTSNRTIGLPDAWLEMAYDFHEHTPKEEIEEIINTNKWSKPGQFSKNEGGTLVCCEILDASDPSGN